MNPSFSFKRVGIGVFVAIAGIVGLAAVLTWVSEPKPLDPDTKKAIDEIAQALVPPQDPALEEMGRKRTTNWSGQLANGTRITDKELATILHQHERWLLSTRSSNDLQANFNSAMLGNIDLRYAKLPTAEFREANLTNAFLWKADLAGADFVGANMTKAVLCNADLSAVSFGNTILRGANFSGAKFASTWFDHADLRETWFDSAKLVKVSFKSANLQKAGFFQADLSGVDLEDADLTDAEFSFADMNDVRYEPRPGTLPNLAALSGATNLSRMNYRDSPQALIDLRDALKKAGFRRQSCEVNYSLMRTRRELAGPLEWVACMAVEIPCDYGMDTARPLKILISLIFVFWLPYLIALRRRGDAGIWKVWPKDRIVEDPAQVNARQAPSGIRRLCVALYFSVLSAFNIGWKEINVGSWIQRLQPEEFVLKPTGWVRSVAGIQSLLSVYLVALWAITFFSGPIGLI
jgi:uncharacterized protein YjbI with pentapeptide repeats